MDQIHRYIFQHSRSFLIPIALLSLLSCADNKITKKIDPFDRQTGTTKQEARDLFFGKKNQKFSSNNSKIPKAVDIPQSSRMIAIPTPPAVNKQKLISFSVTDQVPLKDVLIELAKVAKLDIDLDPSISGGVIINAKNRPLLEVLDRICNMGNLRYSFENNILHIERDLPFTKNYVVDYLVDSELWTQVETNTTKIVTSDNSSSSESSSNASVSSNKQAGILTVFANQKAQTKVAKYLDDVRKNASAQVLIEAKVVEVTLNDNYKTGIDWTWAGGGKSSVSLTAGGTSTENPFAMVIGSRFLGGDMVNNISALEEFGIVKAIASPRINALNNQKATLNFTEKLVYFITEAQSNTTTSSSTSTSAITFTVTKNEETTGTELTITPSIDLKNNEITLSVTPKITVKSSDAEQPYYNPDDGTELGTNLIPIINTRELTTTAKIKSGNILVIGGVMSEISDNTDSGLPFLSRIPLLGYLFKSVTRTSETKETVVFVKATIINTNSGVDKYDKEMHDKFTSSARPFFE